MLRMPVLPLLLAFIIPFLSPLQQLLDAGAPLLPFILFYLNLARLRRIAAMHTQYPSVLTLVSLPPLRVRLHPMSLYVTPTTS
ncbi:hypothetical protein FB45DRAFT_1044212 [Roridomyces roridus]|uniref:Uncharacterized protein n=1 Tax=Roridomyces roridus TaxID=1738132 RepID=A0AAD7AY71_9AGAR|nr:hypothetical protein FB45DRAFT_1044212 [Roridomyces roridus]